MRYCIMCGFSSAVLLYLVNLIMRGLFHHHLPWIDTLAPYLFVLSGLLGAAYAARTDSNIKIEVLKKTAGKKTVRIVRFAVSAAVSAVMLTVFIQHSIHEYARAITSAFHVPTWIIDIPYIFLFLMMVFYYICSLLGELASFSAVKEYIQNTGDDQFETDSPATVSRDSEGT